jgi:trehalose 6-phosphate phosphatase
MDNSSHWTQQQDMLRRLIDEPRFGIVSDFDGTLAPYASTPGGASIMPEIAEIVDTLRERVVVFALVSGRGVNDLRQRYERPWAVYYGNHGIEFWSPSGPQHAPDALRWVEPLQAFLSDFGDPGIDGAFVEDKGVTAAIHYRMTNDPARSRQLLRQRLTPLVERYGLRLSEGQSIFEIKPPVDLHKGTAAQAIVAEHALRSVLFLGDDITDVDAMLRLRTLAAEPAGRLTAVSVGVVHANTPSAVYEACDMTAHGVEDVHALLEWISINRSEVSNTPNRGE